MDTPEYWYWLERARMSRAAARAAANPDIARIHMDLYQRQMSKAEELGGPHRAVKGAALARDN